MIACRNEQSADDSHSAPPPGQVCACESCLAIQGARLKARVGEGYAGFLTTENAQFPPT